MSNVKKSKIQVVPVPTPNATTPGKRATQIELDQAYKTVRGMYVIRNSGTDYLKVEILDPAGRAVIDNVNISHMKVDTNIEIEKRFFTKTPFENKGKTTINIQNFVNATALQDTDIIFLLDNDEI